ncbi:MAG TPA: type II toxin-antitoxin system VapC family toxin [Terriglobales bacterium]|jgi:tRNA(fMet)-specific endonuclease VapC
MALRYLLDTNTASYIIKGNIPNVRERLRRVPLAEVGISSVTEAELRFGAERTPQNSRLAIAVEEFIIRLEVLPWNSESAKQHAILRASLEKKGEPMGNLDMMIAAQALASDLRLVTHDRAFKRLTDLQVEDWTK